ncbi:ATP-grasp domain-containing protein [Salegentibacter sp. LM13S]|uniref:ATP-grasp domain-containing protein n=1 Tax=Salegentibacter lacus TaxID=2873599 RepID=UPI001CCC0F93|nr:ATP-grasp domain-containing protein [Salegentibacter lacus]MBZ9631256.1 ATP-grasp domain-containing protein [Salegentibacter lacus]
MKIVLAGVATISHFDSLIRILDSNNIVYYLIENNLLFHKIPKEYHDKVLMTDQLPLDADLIIPFNEYWISKILFIKKRYRRIGPSLNALYASRSKLKMSEILLSKGIKSVARFPLDKISCLRTKKIVIRPDCGYSGYGILFTEKDKVSTFDQIENIVLSNIPGSMNKILGIEHNQLICEGFIEGQEYSIDVFKNKESVSIIRLSKKKISYIDNVPCVIGYLQIKATSKFSKQIKSWVDAIFDKDDISFAQFDFIENSNNELLPIDFSCRVGSGVSDLIINSANANLYAYCISNVIRKEKYELSFQENWAQFNFIPQKYGGVKQIDISWPTPHIVIYKKNIGDLVKKKHFGSAGNRVIEVIEFLDHPELFDLRCKEINDRISVDLS